MNIEEMKRLAEPLVNWDATSAWEGAEGAAFIGHIDEDGNQYAVACFDLTEYDGFEGDSLKMAQYYAAANPAAILELLADFEQWKSAANANKALLIEARNNDRIAMSWLADCRDAVGDDGTRDMLGFVESLKELIRQRDELLAALRGMVQLDIENHQRGDGDIDIAQEVQAAYNAIANTEKQP